jgi:simple sugar transport system ATP-binding protein
MSGAVLQLSGIEKRFGQVIALDHADFTLKEGTVHALLGENGAGKTSLMRVAFGMVQPDAGAVLVAGQPARFRSPADAIANGLGMVHQHFTHVAAMTVAENVALGGRGLYRTTAAERRVEELGAETGLSLDARARAGDLPVSGQQRLEILKALARNARILILDEPTAVLAPAEAEDLLSWLRAFATRGNSVVLITHKLREALAIADDVTVLRRGRSVLATTADRVTPDDLAAAMLGDNAALASTPPVLSAGAVVVRLDHVTIRDEHGVVSISEATAEIRGGEIVAIAGVEHSGHHELLQTLAGRHRPSSGRLSRSGSVAYVPDDRHRDALVLGFSLAENVALNGAGARRGRMNWSAWRALTGELVAEHDIRPGHVELPVGSLSGGNQQKLVLARELSGRPSLLVAENPTRGLDVRAAAAVHARLRAAAAEGLAVIVYSSDLDEALDLSTRMLVVHAGRVVEVPRDRDRVGRAMLGLA